MCGDRSAKYAECCEEKCTGKKCEVLANKMWTCSASHTERKDLRNIIKQL